MLSKESFVKALELLEKKREQEDRFCSILEELAGGHTYCDAFIYSDYEQLVIDLLEEIFNDNTDLIGYRLSDYYSANDDAKKEMLKQTPELESWSTVYDYLVAHMQEEKK